MHSSTCYRRRNLRSALLLGVILLFPAGESVAQEGDAAKDVSLEWIHKKDDLGIEDLSEFLPGGFRWSPEGHLLAFGQKTDQYGRILVVLNPDKPKDRIVLTGPQVRELLEQLDEQGDGLTPAARLDYPSAIANGPADASGAEDTDVKAGNGAEDERGEEGEEGEDGKAGKAGKAGTDGKEEDNDEEDKDSIVSFSWLEKQNRIRFEFDEHRVLFDPVDYKIFADPKPDLPDGDNENIERSPDDRYAAYTRDNDLHVFDFENGKELRLTDSGSETLLNGKLPWVYWEELMWRRSYRAFWWRPQGDAIAFLQFDEQQVATYPITDFSETVTRTVMQRYPVVGTSNPTVRLGIVGLSSRETRWVDLGEPHEYIINVGWEPDGAALSVQTLNRRQNRLGLYRVDPLTARGELVLDERRDTWVEPFEAPRFVEGGEGFVWLSERTGFRHLYLVSEGGDKVSPLTSGSWVVDQPGFGGRSIFLDSAKRRVYFRGTRESPLERHVYRASLDGGEPRRITKNPGVHSLHFAEDGAYWIDSWSSIDVPRRIDLRDGDGREVARLGQITSDDLAPYRFARPEMVTLDDEDGNSFHGSLLKPLDFDPGRRYPVVAYVYGEPAGQVVQNRWVSAWEMVLVNHGFLVFRFDARGTPGRGRDWLDPIHKNQTELPVQDWGVAVDWLRRLPYVDGERLGIWGWSGGGTMTLNLMLRTPGLFRAGAAVAAVTDKRLYDTIYTERYLGVLKENEDGYKDSSPIFAADKLQGELLIAHGISDDNVHVQNAYNLIEKLAEAEKDYQLYLYPQKRHGIRGDEVQFHLYERILHFFESALKPQDRP